MTYPTSRRRFLQTLGAALSAGLLPNLGRPAAKTTPWLVGCRDIYLKLAGQSDCWSAMKALGAESTEVSVGLDLSCPNLFHPSKTYTLANRKGIQILKDEFVDLSFEIVSTAGTAKVLEEAGLKVSRIAKLAEGRPNALDLLKNREIQLVINTPAGQTPRADEIKIRTTAVYTGTPIMTTLSGARAAALGIAALKKNGYAVKTIQEYH